MSKRNLHSEIEFHLADHHRFDSKRFGFDSLDKITGGVKNGQLIIIASRPGIGKTAFALNLIESFASIQKRSVLFFSYEFSASYIAKRFIETMYDVTIGEASKMTDNTFSQLNNMKDRVMIEDDSRLDIFDILESSVSDVFLNLIVIDKLQLIPKSKDSTQSDQQHFETIVRLLKIWALAKNIPIILMSDLTLMIHNTSFSPNLDDLTHYGNIKQFADQVILIHRPECYGITEDAYGKSTSNVAEFLLVKNKHGGLNDARLGYNKAKGIFFSLETKQ